MKIILKPKSHPELGEIVIEDSFFPIGRFESPFASHQKEAVAKLSRRHARIFQEGGAAYLVDLSDLTGTKLNGQIVQKKPVRLHDGDEVCFANQLSFTVHITGASDAPAAGKLAPAIRLTLAPAQDSAGLEPIVINRFPFLVSKDSEVFSRSKKNLSEAIKYISRRHALFFVRDDNLYVEDLHSKNGTFVSGTQLKEDAVLLKDGDLIAFGNNHLVYSIRIEKDNRAPIREPGTILVSTADSFLNIFCQQDDDENNGGRASAKKANELPNKSGKEDVQGAVHPRLTILSKIRAFLTELKGALREEKPAGSKRVWLVGGVGVLLIVLLAGALYIRGTPERELKSLLAKGQYAQSVELANQYLKEYPGDERISLLATEALLKYLLPPWMELLEKGRFADADALLVQARGLGESNTEGLRIIELMAWINNLEKFLSVRGGSEAPIIIFKHEDQMNTLIDWWDKDDSGHRHLMIIILRHIPSFEDMYSQVFSQLRMINNEKSIYLKAIAELKQTIREKLTMDQAEDLPAVLKSFEKKYPRIEGMDQVWTDLKTWIAIRQAIRTRNLPEALHLSSSAEFSTPPFREKAKDWISNALPPPDVVKEYQKATEAWVSGNFDLALALLNPLTQKAWGEIAVHKLGRYQTVIRDFQALKKARNSPDYGERLLAFYNTLDSTEDTFFLHALETDFQLHKQNLLEDAEELSKSIAQNWNDYQANGGIGGLLRLEDKVSASFEQQASLLTQAHDQVIRGIRIYDLLQLEYPADFKKLYGEILAEVRRQRQWLTDMRMVLEPALLEAKLQLLPPPEESSP